MRLAKFSLEGSALQRLIANSAVCKAKIDWVHFDWAWISQPSVLFLFVLFLFCFYSVGIWCDKSAPISKKKLVDTGRFDQEAAASLQSTSSNGSFIRTEDAKGFFFFTLLRSCLVLTTKLSWPWTALLRVHSHEHQLGHKEATSLPSGCHPVTSWLLLLQRNVTGPYWS